MRERLTIQDIIDHGIPPEIAEDMPKKRINHFKSNVFAKKEDRQYNIFRFLSRDMNNV